MEKFKALFINSGFLTFFVTYVYVKNYSGDGFIYIYLIKSL